MIIPTKGRGFITQGLGYPKVPKCALHSPNRLKDPKMEPPNNPHVAMGSFWGVPFCGSFRGSGS